MAGRTFGQRSNGQHPQYTTIFWSLDRELNSVFNLFMPSSVEHIPASIELGITAPGPTLMIKGTSVLEVMASANWEGSISCFLVQLIGFCAWLVILQIRKMKIRLKLYFDEFIKVLLCKIKILTQVPFQKAESNRQKKLMVNHLY